MSLAAKNKKATSSNSSAEFKKAEVFGNLVLTDKSGRQHKFPKGLALTSDQGAFVAWLIEQARSNSEFSLSNLSMTFQVVDTAEKSFVAPDL